MGNYLPPHVFFRLYPERRGTGKMYGGHCTSARLMRQREKVTQAMSRCRRHWTYENENCDSYVQRVVYVSK